MTTGNSTPLTRALEWISQRIKENPSTNKVTLIDEASQRFDLNPKEGEFLFKQLLRPEGIGTESNPKKVDR